MSANLLRFVSFACFGRECVSFAERGYRRGVRRGERYRRFAEVERRGGRSRRSRRISFLSRFLCRRFCRRRRRSLCQSRTRKASGVHRRLLRTRSNRRWRRNGFARDSLGTPLERESRIFRVVLSRRERKDFFII